ncbi:MAG: DNA polymerase I [Bacteroidales bacterium]|nr:DNA polymerase I [Bacteroidales bacterium]
MQGKTLYLIDAMALIFRSYYALNKNPRINSKGLNTSAALGFFNTLLDIIQKHSPSHLAVCFDVSSQTFRKEEYEDYKANREACPEEILSNLPYIKDLLNAMNIKTLGVEGFEADDVIGTIAKKGKKQGFEVYMVTPDKDYAQLVEDGIFILKLPRMGQGEQIWGVKEVLERFEVKRCEQVIDILGLWGDSSDNIPGVKGIGEKKAKALMQEFDSIEDILENTDRIASASIRKAIEENREEALLSKQLATIRLDVPVDLKEEDFEMKSPNLMECKRLFDELEFRKFADRFFNIYRDRQKKISVSEKDGNLFAENDGKTETQDSVQTDLFSSFSNFDNISNSSCDYICISDLDSLIAEIKEKKYFAFSLLTDKDSLDCSIKAVSFCTEKGKAFFYSTNGQPVINKDLKEIFENREIVKICYDIKKINHALSNENVSVGGNNFDIMLAHYLISSEERGKLDDLSQIYLNYEMISASGNDGAKEKDCLCEQADVVFRLLPVFKEKLKEGGLESLFYDVEMPLSYVLFSMEKEGIRIDGTVLKKYSLLLQEEKEILENKIFEYAGEPFNIGSPKQLGHILFEKLDITEGKKTKKTKTKQFSTSEEVLEKLAAYHPIIPFILEWRRVSKLKNTYVDALPLLTNKKTGRIHTTFNQAVTATGRLSSANPNLQNIPIRSGQGKEIRRAFVPNIDGHYLLSADYSQIELRIIASLSEDEHLCKDFIEGKDIHTSTAAKIYHVSDEEVTKQMRSSAKGVNFGIIYGISAFGLSESLFIPRREAQQLIDEYFLAYPRVKQFIADRIAFAEQNGFAQTVLGRRRYLKNINSANANLRNFDNRNAVNMTIQGTSADMIKIAMVNIYKEIKDRKLESKLLVQIHDELIFDVPESELEIMKELVPRVMQEALPLKVPVVAQCGVGKNWLEMK